MHVERTLSIVGFRIDKRTCDEATSKAIVIDEELLNAESRRVGLNANLVLHRQRSLFLGRCVGVEHRGRVTKRDLFLSLIHI